tara:strand:- start:719 stop:1732 length:1014 start_codon:yes stop_codon:yes gene_type:complete
MKLISLLTKLLHYLPSELSHHIALKGLQISYRTGILGLLLWQDSIKPDNSSKNTRIGVDLINRLGFAAGLDKNGQYIDCLAALGVGFIEVGTVTPRPQPGNPKPRLFRNKKDKSIINRLGFNNGGVDKLVLNLKQRKSSIPLGISIGKNFDTPIELAVEDYSKCMKKVYEYSDYIAINISSPNTLHLRDLSSKEYLDSLLGELKSIQNDLSLHYGYKPLYLKISPDEELHNIKEICRSILNKKIDGIICSNTTIDHQDGLTLGGLSGAPLKNKSNQILKTVKDIVDTKVSIIASGGVMSDADYQEKLKAGADLVQIYTGFIYEGPQLIKDILSAPTS